MTGRQLRSASQKAAVATLNFKASKAKAPADSLGLEKKALKSTTLSVTRPSKETIEDDKNNVSAATTSRKRKLSVQISGKDDQPETRKPKKTDVKISVEKKKNAPKSTTAKETTRRKAKSAAASLTQSPFPTHAHPTPDECQVVHDLLTRAHGPARRPNQFRQPSATISGCGEVPSVFDSLMRTLLSANTTAANSNRALQGLLKRFGEGERGSINWEAVRKAKQKDVADAIRSGGLADMKSKRILEIANQMYEEGKETGNGFSLDYLHEATDDEVMEKLTSFNGIGVKTASCVLMFCLRRNLFPVDTHVFRISQLLGWVPTPFSIREEDEAAKANGDVAKKKRVPVTRDSTFLHLNAVIPNELKYGLHQLLIRHGRYCPSCNGKAGRSLGLGTHGRPLERVTKEIIVKEETEDGSFEEVRKTVTVKEERSEDEDESGEGVVLLAGLNDIPIKGEEVEEKAYVPIDAAGGTGEKTGGKGDGSCILGDLVSWERLSLSRALRPE